jgi:amino acid transporter
MFIGIFIASLSAYYFTSEIFEEDRNRKKEITLIVVSIIGILIGLIFENSEWNDLIELIVFLLLAFNMWLVYIPFAKKTHKISKRKEIALEDQKKMKSLSLMAVSFMGCILFTFLTSIELIITGYAYGITYIISMAALLFGLYFSFKGYMKSTENKKEK